MSRAIRAPTRSAGPRIRTTLCRALMLAALAPFAAAADAMAQACIGLPADQGRIAVQLEATAGDAKPSYGGRLGMNFNTPFTLEASIQRPRFASGIGTAVGAGLAYEMLVYEPVLCPFAGFRHETRPVDGGEKQTRLVPLGIGIGRRLGSARGLSFSIFARPEYLYVVDRDGPDGEAGLRGLGDRSEGRGVLGVVLASPFLYATGAVEVGTIDDYEPHFTLGIGMTF